MESFRSFPTLMISWFSLNKQMRYAFVSWYYFRGFSASVISLLSSRNKSVLKRTSYSWVSSSFPKFCLINFFFKIWEASWTFQHVLEEPGGEVEIFQLIQMSWVHPVCSGSRNHDHLLRERGRGRISLLEFQQWVLVLLRSFIPWTGPGLWSWVCATAVCPSLLQLSVHQFYSWSKKCTLITFNINTGCEQEQNRREDCLESLLNINWLVKPGIPFF